MKLKKLTNIAMAIVGVVFVGGIVYLFQQKFSADSSAGYKEVAKMDYSIKVVDRNDKEVKGIANKQVSITTQFSSGIRRTSDGKYDTATLISDASGLIKGEQFSVCTKDDKTYAVMASGCTERVRYVNAGFSSTDPRQQGISVPVDVGYDVPGYMFKDLYKNTSNSAGVTGQWSTETSLLYSDGSGGKVVSNTSEVKKKYYQVGTVDISAQLLTSKDNSTTIGGRSIIVESYSSAPRKVSTSFMVYSSTYNETDKSKNLVSSQTINMTSDTVTAGHYTVCYKDRRYYVMSDSCKSKVMGMYLKVDNSSSSTNSNAKKIELIQQVNQGGKGYSKAEFSNVYTSKNGTAINSVEGDFKSIKTIILYLNGGGKRI